MNQPSPPIRTERPAETEFPFGAPVIVVSGTEGPAGSMTGVPADNDQLERQLSAILRPTTVEDLARKGGPLKTVNERDLRELIRQSLLQLLATETSLGGAEQERILDRIQGELKKRMTAHAAEQAERLALVADHQVLQTRLAQLEQDYQKSVGDLQRLRAEVPPLSTPQPLPTPQLNEDGQRSLDEAFFAGGQQREAARFGTSLSDAVTAALHRHLGVCTALLATMVAEPAGVDAAADVVARIRLLVETRTRDRQWIVELQQRLSEVSAERDEARAAAEAELQHTIEVETQRDELLAASEEAAQRKTTSLARPAAVDAEALRSEVDGFKTLLRERELVLANERARHRADSGVHLQALKRVEQALLALHEQLAERDRQLADARADLAPPGKNAATDTERGLEVAALMDIVAQGRQDQAALGARLADQERACRQAERERDEVRVQQADRMHLARERDLMSEALREVEARLTAREQELAGWRELAKPAVAPVAEKQPQRWSESAPIHAELAALRAALQRRPPGRHGGSSRYR